MRRAVACVLAGALSLQTSALFASQLVVARAQASGPQAVQGAAISGIAVNPIGEPLENVTVQVRDLLTGQIAKSTVTSAGGHYSIVGLNQGNYVLEIVEGGRVVGTSGFISIGAGTTLTIAPVVASTGLAAAAAGSTALAVTMVAVAAGVAGVLAPAARETASPSR